tara:strand:- start:687 stop:1046 length:360 start_codon:yes stop_codon:yes gene_type:complete
MNKKVFKEFLSARQKIELARKPQSILSEANKLDNKISSAESRMDKMFLNYKQTQKEWVNLLTDVSSDLDSLEDDLVKILDKAQEIGVDGRQIDGFSKAADTITRLQNIARNSKNLYPKI